MRPLHQVLAIMLLAASPASAAGLTWSFGSDILTLDPHSSRVSFTNAFLANIYETLVRMDDKLQIEPALAVSWERRSPLVWRFHLRPGVTFHGGEAFTADDVAFTWTRLNTPGANRGPLAAVTAMRAVDAQTVDIETAQPFPVLLNALLGMGIMSRSWSEAHGAAASSDLSASTENFATRHENGTGPFVVESRQPDGPTVLKPFRAWWDKPVHNLDQVTFLPIKNAATRTASLLSGSTDATVDVPLQDVDRLSRDPRLQVVQGPELRTIYIGFDEDRDELLYSDVKGRNPFKDRRVREALYRAIDIEAIRRTVMRGQAWPAGFMASPLLTGAPQDLNQRLPFDPDRARQLLAEAGYRDGFGFSLTCPNDRYVNDERICQAIASMWARVGIRASVQSETTAVWSRRTAQGDVTAFMLGHAALPLAEVYSTLNDVIHSKTAEAGGLNYGRYNNPRVDRLIDQVAGEADDAKRAAAVREAFLLEKQDIGHIPLHQQPLTWASRKGVDMRQAPDNSFRLYLVRVD
jgi:peptide/nickel transport system substrate-binding protein